MSSKGLKERGVLGPLSLHVHLLFKEKKANPSSGSKSLAP